MRIKLARPRGKNLLFEGVNIFFSRLVEETAVPLGKTNLAIIRAIEDAAASV